MENSSYPLYVTEHIRRFDNTPFGVCYPASVMHCDHPSPALLNEIDMIAQKNYPPEKAEIHVIPLAEYTLSTFLDTPNIYSSLQRKNVRLAINYAGMCKGGETLRALANDFSFWLYDLAAPGTNWQNISAFPFSGVVLDEAFFNDNYHKFSFPFLMETWQEREAEVILRTAALMFDPSRYAQLHLTGWQEQRASGAFFAG